MEHSLLKDRKKHEASKEFAQKLEAGDAVQRKLDGSVAQLQRQFEENMQVGFRV